MTWGSDAEVRGHRTGRKRSRAVMRKRPQCERQGAGRGRGRGGDTQEGQTGVWRGFMPWGLPSDPSASSGWLPRLSGSSPRCGSEVLSFSRPVTWAPAGRQRALEWGQAPRGGRPRPGRGSWRPAFRVIGWRQAGGGGIVDPGPGALSAWQGCGPSQLSPARPPPPPAGAMKPGRAPRTLHVLPRAPEAASGGVQPPRSQSPPPPGDGRGQAMREGSGQPDGPTSVRGHPPPRAPQLSFSSRSREPMASLRHPLYPFPTSPPRPLTWASSCLPSCS